MGRPWGNAYSTRPDDHRMRAPLLVLAIAMVLTGCGTSTSAPSSTPASPASGNVPEQRFLSSLAAAAPAASGRWAAATLTGYGYAACTALNSDAAHPEVAVSAVANSGVDDASARAIVRAAADNLCPAFSAETVSPTAAAVGPADRTITVPDLSGMTGQQASDALDRAGVLDVEFAQNNAPLSQPVTGQNPPAGTQQRAGNPVGVTLAPAAPAAPQPLTEVTPGTYEVGTGDGQVAPGKYKSSGPDGGVVCYYARLKSNDGSNGDIIANTPARARAS
jgi:PASTA domain/Protein of unknown function (DUF732)